MKYIFHPWDVVGENPIKEFQLCWYDMKNGGSCFDEDWIVPSNFGITEIAYIDCDKNKHDETRTRLFVHTKKGEMYELRLHRIKTEKQRKECETFYGGRDD